MAQAARERPRSWLIWVIAGVVVALLVIGIYQFTRQAQQVDLPRPAEVALEVPTPPTLPDAPNLPAAPIPAPR